MSTVNDGGPAFPLLGDGPNAPCFNEGMTLRDYFAAHALKSLAQASIERGKLGGITLSESCDMCAETCYLLADAMLAAREEAQP